MLGVFDVRPSVAELIFVLRKYFKHLDDERGRANPVDMPEKQKSYGAHELDLALQSFGVASAEKRRSIIAEAQKEVFGRKPAIVVPPLPKKSEVKRYDERRKDPKLAKLNIIEFLEAVWGPWIKPKTPAEMLELELKDQLLTRAKLRELDASADAGIENWLSFKGTRQLPKHIQILPKDQAYTIILDFDPRAAFHSERLAQALVYRARKAAKSRPTPG